MTHTNLYKAIDRNYGEVKDMPQKARLEKGEIGMGLDGKTIKLLHSLTPENFGEFRDKFNALTRNERSLIMFCA